MNTSLKPLEKGWTTSHFNAFHQPYSDFCLFHCFNMVEYIAHANQRSRVLAQQEAASVSRSHPFWRPTSRFRPWHGIPRATAAHSSYDMCRKEACNVIHPMINHLGWDRLQLLSLVVANVLLPHWWAWTTSVPMTHEFYQNYRLSFAFPTWIIALQISRPTSLVILLGGWAILFEQTK